MKTFDGYSKEKFSDTSVLLAGGGSKELSNFIGTLNWDSTNRKLQYKKIGDTNWNDLVTFGSNALNSTAYLPLAGGTMTGDLTVTSINFLDTDGSKPVLKISSPNKDTTIWRVYSNDLTYGLNSSIYGYSLKYLGTGSGNNNKLVLIADNLTGARVTAVSMTLDGVTTFNSVPYVGNTPVSLFPYIALNGGLSASSSVLSWGTTTGTCIAHWSDGAGGNFSFRKNCPSSGKVSMIIDGYIYQNEGNYRVLDTSDKAGLFTDFSSSASTNLSITVGGTTKSITNLYSGYLKIHDIRGTAHAPNATYYPEKLITAWFNATGTPASNWWSGITIKGWTSDYSTWLLCSYSGQGTPNGHSLYLRNGINDSWGSWKTILDSSNYKSVIGSGTFWKVNDLTTVGTGDIYLEMWRGTNASWKMLNSGGVLKFLCNYTSTVGSYYDALTVAFNTGNVWTKGSISGNYFTSRVETGTQPYACTSTTLNTNLNADLLDGYHANGLFTNLSNSGNNISITIGGTNKTLTPAYATKAGNADISTLAKILQGVNIGNSDGSVVYYKVSNLIEKKGNCLATYIITTRNIENYYVSIGTDDSKWFNPSITCMHNSYSKIESFAWKEGVLYIKSNAYNNNIRITCLTNTTTIIPVVTISNESEFTAATAISIKNNINSANYNSYSPTLTGTGANGTWDINISGNADTVDNYHASSLITWSGALFDKPNVSWSNAANGVKIYSHYSSNSLGYYRAILQCKAPDNAIGLEFNAYWCVNPSDSASNNNIYYRVKRDSAADWGPYTKLLLSDGDATITGSYYANSDIRYKLIQSLLLNKVNSIAELPIFTYYWKDDKHDDKLHIGSSAQAVNEIFPELVTYDELKDFYNLDYATLGTIAGITACKELVNLKSEIDLLKERIKELELQLKMINDY